MVDELQSRDLERMSWKEDKDKLERIVAYLKTSLEDGKRVNELCHEEILRLKKESSDRKKAVDLMAIQVELVVGDNSRLRAMLVDLGVPVPAAQAMKPATAEETEILTNAHKLLNQHIDRKKVLRMQIEMLQAELGHLLDIPDSAPASPAPAHTGSASGSASNAP